MSRKLCTCDGACHGVRQNPSVSYYWYYWSSWYYSKKKWLPRYLHTWGLGCWVAKGSNKSYSWKNLVLFNIPQIQLNMPSLYPRDKGKSQRLNCSVAPPPHPITLWPSSRLMCCEGLSDSLSHQPPGFCSLSFPGFPLLPHSPILGLLSIAESMQEVLPPALRLKESGLT